MDEMIDNKERENIKKFLELVDSNPELKQSIEILAEDLGRVKKIINEKKIVI